jgi:hypothetical protein
VRAVTVISTFISFLLLPKSGVAAAISVSMPANGAAKVVIQGDLIDSDATEFKSKTAAVPNAIVRLESDGGSLIAGIAIGETIRLKGFSTFVPDRVRCASACAIAWLGGSPRYMAPNARIGFHAAYDLTSGQETGMGNALVGAYLTRIGLPYSAVIYITQAPPNSMTWLSLPDAKRRGIEVSFLKGEDNAPPALRQPVELGGYSVQVLSQRTEADALTAYSLLQQKFPSVLVGRSPTIRRADLGEHGVFYRANVGPFSAHEADEFCSRLKAAGGQCIIQKE